MQELRRFLPLAALISLGAAACNSKKDDPQPDPATEMQLIRSFTYPTASSYNNSITYSQKTLQSSAVLGDKGLYIGFAAVEGKDGLSFTIDPGSVAAGLTGTYALREVATPQNPATAHYVYTISDAPGASSFRLFDSPEIAGQVTVTSYNAQRKLITGSFQVRLDNVSDPASSTPFSSPQCNVDVKGTFTNLKLTN